MSGNDEREGGGGQKRRGETGERKGPTDRRERTMKRKPEGEASE